MSHLIFLCIQVDTSFIRRHFPLEPDWCALDKVSRGSVQETPGWLKGENINIDYILFIIVYLQGAAKLLDSGLAGSDWRALAGYLGYNSYKVSLTPIGFCVVSL